MIFGEDLGDVAAGGGDDVFSSNFAAEASELIDDGHG